jgi:hypothetical protein
MLSNHFVLEDLPTEMISEIIEYLNVLDIIRLTSTNKFFYKTFKPNKLPHLSLRLQDTTEIYTNVNDLVTTIADDLKNFDAQWYDFNFPREFRYTRSNNTIKLRFTKNYKTGNCTFIITDYSKAYPNYFIGIQVVYEPDYSRYRIIVPNNKSPSEISCILFFIGFKVLFNIHGYEFAKTFKDMHMHHKQDHDSIFPEWLQRMVTSSDYNGALFEELVDDVITI